VCNLSCLTSILSLDAAGAACTLSPQNIGHPLRNGHSLRTGQSLTTQWWTVVPCRVIQRAYEMSIEHKVWERPMGLLGIWGSLIEKVSSAK
jgi:hypothetical protein